MDKIYFSYNPNIVNKNDNEENLGKGWLNTETTVSELFEYITVNGYAVTSQVKDGHRKSDNFIQTNIILIDVDGGLVLKEALSKLSYSLLGYYVSPSCTHLKQKFRLVFKTPYSITDAETVSKLRLALNHIYKGDPSTTDCCRLFYGNNKNKVKCDGLPFSEIFGHELTIKQVNALIKGAETLTHKRYGSGDTYISDNEIPTEWMRAYIIDKLRLVDLSDYHIWRNLACAMQDQNLDLCDFIAVSSCSIEDCTKTWNAMLKNKPQSQITAGTLWHMIGGRQGYYSARANNKIKI